MPRLLYTSLLYLLTPMILLRLWRRGRTAPAYRRRVRERFGWIPPLPADRPVLWVHAVSVGETLAAVPLVKALQQRHSKYRILVTTMTPTGSDRVRAALGDSVAHFYAPYDLPGAVRRFLRRAQPRLLIVMETELWPNIVAACADRDIPVLLANARLSEKSARGYARLRGLTRTMLTRLATVAAQAQADGQRFRQLGLPDERLLITGNIKFDLDISDELEQRANRLRKEWQGGRSRPVWLAASTHAGEDEIILAAHRDLLERFPNLLLVLVPRHPERFESVFELCRREKVSVARRSQQSLPDGCQVLLGDTMGELLVFYGACDIAFVGGSLVASGGHSLIEPAAWRKPVLAGTHLFNFAEVSNQLQAADALLLCQDAGEIASAVGRLLENPVAMRQRGERAWQVAESNRGALQRLLGVVDSLIEHRTGSLPTKGRGSRPEPLRPGD